MNGTALQYALQLLQALPPLIQAGVNVAHVVTVAHSRLETFEAEGRDPEADEWAELNDLIDAQRAKLHSDTA